LCSQKKRYYYLGREDAQPTSTIYGVISGASPNASAIEGVEGGRITYGQLRANAQRIVGFLNSSGFRRNDRIAIPMPSGPVLAVALASVASGFTAIPINPEFKPSEFEKYLLDLHPKAVLTLAGTMQQQNRIAEDLGIETMGLFADRSPGAGAFSLSCPETANRAEPDFTRPDDTILVLLTSGTTALPKKIPWTNRNMHWGIRYCNEGTELGPSPRMLFFAPLFHASGMIILWRALFSGGTAICGREFEPSEFFRWLDETRATQFFASPARQQSILKMAGEHMDVIARSALRWIMSGTTTSNKEILERTERTFKVPVIDSYGSTETIVIGFSPLPPRKSKYGAIMPCVPELAIHDENGRSLPSGRTGEIAVRGPQIFKGYEEDPEANAQVFVNGWLRTGDLGLIDGEGYLHLKGRVKDIINKGGEKISPLEIDEALMEHPSVLDALTFPVPHQSLGEDVDAAVVLRPDRKAGEFELRAFLFQRLAYFKVPTRLVFVDEIPKGPTGKASRRDMAKALGLDE
jgi:acyl-coenzyme A synthetase/AMP-(fatty) acid ligase